MTLENAINNTIKKLKAKVKKSGIYENFGQKEVALLTDKWIDSSAYTNEMNKRRELIQVFNEWCMNYTGN